MMLDSALKEHAQQLIRTKGGRATKPRMTTLATLLASQQALGHGDLRKHLPTMDRVSRYRALEWLIEHGLVYRINDAGQVKYGAQLHQSDHQHPHFSCVNCGHTTCLNDIDLSQLQLPSGYHIHSIETVVKGICQKCSDEK